MRSFENARNIQCDYGTCFSLSRPTNSTEISIVHGFSHEIEMLLLCRWSTKIGASYRRCWRTKNTYIKVKGVWKYLYRAVDKDGKTIDFLLTAKRDEAAAMCFFDKAIQGNGTPENVSMDKSGAKKSAIDQIIENKSISVIIRQIKYLIPPQAVISLSVKRSSNPMMWPTLK